MGWWESLLEQYRRDGASDADYGVFDLPYFQDDPEGEEYNHAYIEGFRKRRKELGEKFKWS